MLHCTALTLIHLTEKDFLMKKLSLAVLVLAFAGLGGCANMPGAMVGTAAVSKDTLGAFGYPAGSWPEQLWTNGD